MSVLAPSQLPKAEKLHIAFAFYAAALLEGLMLASIGPNLDSLAFNSTSTTDEIAILFTANSLGYIAGSLIVDWRNWRERWLAKRKKSVAKA
jgi:MFS family permease